MSTWKDLKTVIYEKDGPIALITLNRPESLNAYDIPMCRELTRVWLDFRDDPKLQVAILTGKGRAFCAGGDVKSPENVFNEAARKELRTSHKALKAWEEGGKEPGPEVLRHPPFPTPRTRFNIWKPIIAAVNGWAVAGGFAMVLNSDIVVASEEAKFGITQSKVGFISPLTGGATAFRYMPKAVALYMTLTGQPVTAHQAMQWGLCTHVVSPKELLPTARSIADTIVRDVSPTSIRAMKESFYRAFWRGAEEDIKFSASLMNQRVVDKGNYAEGMRAFAERRTPKWEAPSEGQDKKQATDNEEDSRY